MISRIVYKIVGTCKGKSEVIDEAENKANAQYLVQEYHMAFGPDWIISIVEAPECRS